MKISLVLINRQNKKRETYPFVEAQVVPTPESNRDHRNTCPVKGVYKQPEYYDPQLPITGHPFSLSLSLPSSKLYQSILIYYHPKENPSLSFANALLIIIIYIHIQCERTPAHI